MKYAEYVWSDRTQLPGFDRTVCLGSSQTGLPDEMPEGTLFGVVAHTGRESVYECPTLKAAHEVLASERLKPQCTVIWYHRPPRPA